MPKLKIVEQNQTLFHAGTHERENLQLRYEMHHPSDMLGCPTGKPDGIKFVATRTVPPHQGDLLLLRVAVDSRRWPNLALNGNPLPTAEATLDVPLGSGVQETLRLNLEDIQVGSWTLHWQGQGADGLQGCQIQESLNLQGLAAAWTALLDNESVEVDLRPDGVGD